MSSPWFPQLKLGDKIEFSNDPQAPEGRWRLGEVTALKTDSCDAVVYQLEGLDFRHDLMFVEDPRCFKTKDWAGVGRGIFRLAAVENERRARDARVDTLEKKVDVVFELLRTDSARPSGRPRQSVTA